MDEKLYDIIIVGGGPAGLTAGIYASRGGMRTLLLERMGCGGQAVITDWIENYPGFVEGISGFELASKMQEQAIKFGLEIKNEEVLKIENDSKSAGGKTIKTHENIYGATAVVIATGANFKHLKIPGEMNFIGKGVSYCATCDGPFFKGKDVVVVGGGDSAVQEASFLTKFANTVTLIHRRDRLRAAQVLRERIKSNPKIKFKLSSIVEIISGTARVESITVKNVLNGNIEEFKTDGVFIFVGQTPNTAFLQGALKTDEAGFIITDASMRTSGDGIFACGDTRVKLLKQVVTACGDGALASFAAQEYVEEVKGTSYK
jgi:thioredoxin reductase (NADPH)